jgi:5'-3' exonuclease
MLLLVDYSSLLYRAFFSMPETIPMHGVHGFLSMLARLVRDRRPTRVGIAVDDDWRPAFRVEALPMYKAHRAAESEGEEEDPIAPQEAFGRELLGALGLAVVGAEGFEAEDVIATLAARTRGRVEIVSGDRDLFALVQDPRVSVLYPLRGVRDLVEVDEAEITRRYGIPGRAYLDFALLRGDPSDGLPGVKGIGEKTATKLIADYGSLAAVLSAGDLPPTVSRKLDAGRDYLAAACRVVPPVCTVPLDAVDLTPPRAPAHPRTLARLVEEQELGGPVRRLRDALRMEAGAR